MQVALEMWDLHQSVYGKVTDSSVVELSSQGYQIVGEEDGLKTSYKKPFLPLFKKMNK